MAQTTKTTCDFCQDPSEAATTYNIFVDSSAGRVPFDACQKCAFEKLGVLSDAIKPKKPEPRKEGEPRKSE